jgi:hypothetical protein
MHDKGRVAAIGLFVVMCSALVAAQAGVMVLPGQARDPQAPGAATPADVGTGVIAGQVTMAGSGQPVEGARVTVSGGGLRGSRSALSDIDGQFAFVDLPEGTFTLRATLTGYISGTYGQKRPGGSGTPIALVEGQQFKSASVEIAKGGVISGAVFDERNRPSIRTSVRAMRWVLQGGQRVLSNAGSATTDDRGIYRIFGLTPGDYVVSAQPRNTTSTVVTIGDLQAMERLEVLREAQAVGSNFEIRIEAPEPSVGRASDPVEGYAPVYYPGTTQFGGAQALRVTAGQEHLGIDFPLQRVPLTTVTGQVLAPPGVNVRSVQVRLMHRDTAQIGIGQQSARPNASGVFTIRSVVPGDYLVTAIVNVTPPRQAAPPQAPGGQPVRPAAPPPQRRLWAESALFVDGSYAPTVTLTMQEGVSVSGSVVYNGSSPLPPPNRRVRVSMRAQGQPTQSMRVGTLSANVDETGRFRIDRAIPGQYTFSATGATGWQVKSVLANGVDVLDFPFTIKAGEPVPDITVQFGDQTTRMSGVLTGSNGTPNADYTVVIFPDDQRYWIPFARRMRSTRPSTDGKFGFSGLPPGEYRLAAVTDVDASELQQPDFLRQLLGASIGVRLIAGQDITQDIRVR